MKRWMHALGLLALVGGLWGCAGTSGVARVDGMPSASERQEPDVFPGGWRDYSWGLGQTRENFVNVAIAQFDYSPYGSTQRTWKSDVPDGTGPSATMLGLTAYWPLSVHWKLKDGREFMLDKLDLRPIMREYFKTHRIELQWQKEGRHFENASDYEPTLIHQVKDDTVLIEWVITANTTPVKERFLPSGAATQWHLTKERYLVTTLKGTPTSGIEFDKRWEFFRNSQWIKE
ncbi:hypothetical protein RQP54_14420 [Curvibacter sp. APW13]|uniref:hypothetical protein n=1 Tax=Curvibacter sp. APW13 TaxID=3077236 RepID=UPI0028DF76B1|nr:hypothetical protein [Curvibacter sp. APW13]MDT8992064.1 hypothetical protein [Curvibacter sp. APW13]